MSTTLNESTQLRGALSLLADAHSQVAILGDRMNTAGPSEYRELMEALNLLISIATGLRAFVTQLPVLSEQQEG